MPILCLVLGLLLGFILGRPCRHRKPLRPGQWISIRCRDLDELERVPGIGPALAARVIAVDPKTVVELKQVHGIGDESLKDIAPYFRD